LAAAGLRYFETMEELSKLIGAAAQFFHRGNLPQAELICRYINRWHGEIPPVSVLLGQIALAAELYDYAEKYFRQAAEAEPGNREATEGLALASAQGARCATRQTQPANKRDNADENPRFLLIKAWGFGFWSDMDHVLGQLLLAEISGRVPVVHWGDNSLFRDEGCDNAFEAFFEPVSTYTLEDLRRLSSSFFPPKWTPDNLTANNVNKWEGAYSRVAGFQLLDRPEDTVVSDFYTYLNDIVPWIPESRPYHGLGTQELYRRVLRKYIRPIPAIAARIEAFWQSHLSGRKPLAVHVRGSDKFYESDQLHEVNKTYHAKIAEFLEAGRCDTIFLLTDSREVLDKFTERYGEKLVHTDCARTDSDTGVHHQPRVNPQQTGIEVVVDVYLAARCACFIGNGHSNVSTSILHWRDWKDDEYVLIGENMLMRPSFLLHQR
jgi:protein O-GlcNAc transferase